HPCTPRDATENLVAHPHRDTYPDTGRPDGPDEPLLVGARGGHFHRLRGVRRIAVLARLVVRRSLADTVVVAIVRSRIALAAGIVLGVAARTIAARTIAARTICGARVVRRLRGGSHVDVAVEQIRRPLRDEVEVGISRRDERRHEL